MKTHAVTVRDPCLGAVEAEVVRLTVDGEVCLVVGQVYPVCSKTRDVFVAVAAAALGSMIAVVCFAGSAGSLVVASRHTESDLAPNCRKVFARL